MCSRFVEEEKLTEINPIINRNGYYLMEDFCWFEFNGKAYEYEVESFKYKLKLLNAKVFREVELKAIELLINANIADSQLRDKYYTHRDNMQIRGGGRKMRMRIMRIRSEL